MGRLAVFKKPTDLMGISMATAIPSLSFKETQANLDKRLLAEYRKAVKKGHVAALRAIYNKGREDEEDNCWYRRED